MSRHELSRAFARLPLLRQYAVLMAVVLLLGCTVIALVGTAHRHARALERARLIAMMVDAAGTWSSQYRGVWVLSDPTDAGAPVGDSLDHRAARTADASSAVDIARTAGMFHRKVPSTVQRELADLMGRMSNGEHVRITHDVPLDARNAPNVFEQAAIERLRRIERPRDEHFETAGGRLLYARRLAVREDCVRCHVAASDHAPAAMKVKLGTSPGWGDVREGAFAGIVSVSVPLGADGDADRLANMAGMLWIFLSAWAGAFALLLWWLQRQVIRAAEAMESYAQCLVAAKPAVRASRVVVDQDELGSGNELHRVSMALKAVHRALRTAYVKAP